MSAQPANTAINVFRTVRAQRQDVRHDNVEAITKKLRPLVMSVPGQEVLSGALTRDTNIADFSPYMGESRYGASRGMPVVVGLKDTTTYAAAQEGITGLDFGIKIGRDAFLTNSAAGLSRDLHQDLRDV